MAVEQKKFKIVASIVLYHHSYAQVENTLISLLNEQSVDRIILVDNGGSEWVSSLDNDRIDYISCGENTGFGHGHNLAMAQYLTDCHYFLICNPDISFSPTSLEGLYRFAYEGQHQFVAPRIHYTCGRFQYSCRLLPTPANLLLRRFVPKLGAKMDINYELQRADYTQTFAVPSVSGCFMLIKSELLETLKGFDERYFMYLEDVDLCRRASQLTDIYYFSGATVTHVFGKGSYKNLTMLRYHVRSAISYFNKWGWLFDKDRRHYNQRYLKSIPMIDSGDKMSQS
ncbi:glycosyltransferase [Serratia rubidaea]|uniref:dTDP-Rha:alpha-D-GlcNAc-pyrophosphate polyprenol, alpha-3-L-rhamnosyltransferase n=1 Tax=Serratia rubidaea TaxID=61652 RepID=A0A3S4X4P0_SERRU|nr:glycosyltransferase family 2 protein [Serratia rubidaea]MEB7584256.1 glycosyltransferase family 2 protein [Serratia rubidaea]VEI72522.1 dTDP-Rha:alpha-D-GlcNAc-pyrophosphate polyprenol, alpha-3-L-rhamnosyltransferase [Serratia rubidaea]